MPLTHDDVTTAAQLLVDELKMDSFQAVEAVTRFYRQSMIVIDDEVEKQLAYSADHSSAHDLVMDWLTGYMLSDRERTIGVPREAARVLLTDADVQAALIAYTVESASERVTRVLPLMRHEQAQQLALDPEPGG